MNGRVFFSSLLLASCAAAPGDVGDCSPRNCLGCCDARGTCQGGATKNACGSGGFRCAVCPATHRCSATTTCEADPNVPQGGGTASGTGGGAAVTTAQQEFVVAHNTARRRASPTPAPALPEVAWDDTVAAFAKLGADRCIFEHRSQMTYGENLHASTSESSPTSVVEGWESEKRSYSYANNGCSSVCGHYTQVVWRSSVRIGCATARCMTGSPFAGSTEWYLTACNYDPPGNYSGMKPY